MAYVPKSAQLKNRGNAIDRAKRESRVFGGSQNGRPGQSKTPTPAAIKSATKIANSQPPNPKGAKAFDRAKGLAKKTIVAPTKKGGSPSSSGKPTTTSPASPSTGASPATSPFLTPAQQRALSDYDANFGYNLGALRRKVGDATANTNQASATATRTAVANTNNANQNTAARGLFQSSIRDADLNDIDSTLAMRNNTLHTNLNRIMLDTNSQVGRLTTDWTNTHNFYNSLAVANAQNVTPDVTTPAPTTTPSTTASSTASSGVKTAGSTTSAAKGTGGAGGRIQGGNMGAPKKMKMPRWNSRGGAWGTVIMPGGGRAPMGAGVPQ